MKDCGDRPKHNTMLFTPQPEIDGIPVGDDHNQHGAPSLNIHWPVTATITNLRYCNSEDNNSFRNLEDAPGNAMINRAVVHTDEEGVMTESTPPFSVLGAGYRFECDIEIDEGFGIADSQLVKTNVAVCNLFGGVNNYGFMTPGGTTNSAAGGNSRFRNGDRVVVQFIGGRMSKPIITGYYPHPLNVSDGPRFSPGAPQLGFTSRIVGTRINVNESGVFIDTSETGVELLIDSKTGKITEVHPNRKIITAETQDDEHQPIGEFKLTTKSRITLDASYEDEDVNVGDILLQSKTQGTFKSQIENINIYTDLKEKDVILQEKHGSLRDAARKNDKIKITSGDPNDLFAWCARVSNTLSQAGKLMATQDLFDIACAGTLLEGLGNGGFPSYAEGRIIEGSPYVQIAGIPTGPDNTDKELEDACQEEVAGSFASNLSGTCAVNNLAEYFLIIDNLVKVIEVLEQPVPDPADPVPPLLYQILPPGSAAMVNNLKLPIAEWLATCPEIPPFWPPEFAGIINPILALDVADLAALPGKLIGVIPLALAELLNPSAIAEVFSTPSEKETLDADIATGLADDGNMTVVNTETNGAYDSAIITCLDEEMSS